ncbi:hypothetical protein BDW69DRAFT_75457 [Aspergillus filifer]
MLSKHLRFQYGRRDCRPGQTVLVPASLLYIGIQCKGASVGLSTSIGTREPIGYTKCWAGVLSPVVQSCLSAWHDLGLGRSIHPIVELYTEHMEHRSISKVIPTSAASSTGSGTLDLVLA